MRTSWGAKAPQSVGHHGKVQRVFAAGDEDIAEHRRLRQSRIEEVFNHSHAGVVAGEPVALRGHSQNDAFDRAPQGRELSVREALTRIIVDWFGSWQAARPGNWPGRSPATKAA
jgi:hypothetical protein